MTGAMTSTFIGAIKEAANNKRKLTYHGIMDSMHRTLKQAHKSGCISTGLRRVFHRKILQVLYDIDQRNVRIHSS